MSVLLNTISTNNSSASNRGNTKVIPPSDSRVKLAFQRVSAGELELTDEQQKAIQQGVQPPKQLLGFDLIHREAQQLSKCRECSNGADMARHMKKNGYTNVECEIIDDTDDTATQTYAMYSKDNSHLVYSMDATFIQSLVMPRITSDNRHRDEGWVFNYQDKLCTSLVKTNEPFYYSNGRLGLVLNVGSENVVEAFARDKLTPTGFRKVTTEKRSKEEIDQEKADVENVQRYIAFQEKYRKLVFYADMIQRQCALIVANGGNKEAQAEAYALIASFDKLSLALSSTDAIKGTFLRESGLTQKLKQFQQFAKKHANLLDTTENYDKLFQSENSSGTKSIVKEIEVLTNLSEKIDENREKYHSYILHRKASEWGPKFGHEDTERGTTAYLTGQVLGKTDLERAPRDPHYNYNEINIKIPKEGDTTLQKPEAIDVAAFRIDTRVLDQRRNGGFSLNLPALRKDLAAANAAWEKAKTDLTSDPSNAALSEKCNTLKWKVWEINQKLAMADIIKKSAAIHIPILV